MYLPESPTARAFARALTDYGFTTYRAEEIDHSRHRNRFLHPFARAQGWVNFDCYHAYADATFTNYPPNEFVTHIHVSFGHFQGRYTDHKVVSWQRSNIGLLEGIFDNGSWELLESGVSQGSSSRVKGIEQLLRSTFAKYFEFHFANERGVILKLRQLTTGIRWQLYRHGPGIFRENVFTDSQVEDIWKSFVRGQIPQTMLFEYLEETRPELQLFFQGVG